MIRKLQLLVLFLLFVGASAFAQTSLSGKVTDVDSGEPIISATVKLMKGESMVQGTVTDFDGNYSFSNIDPTTYDVEISYIGYSPQKVEGVNVLAGKAINLDVELSEGVLLDKVIVIGYKNPLIEQDNTTQGAVITSEDIKKIPTRNVTALAAASAGVASADEGDAVSVRGSRTESTDYYIDGVRVQGSMIPESEIDQLQVITGGIEARYGDVTGGIISITTKGPSEKFSGGIEAETSKYLDAYNNNLVGINLSGPIIKKKNEDGEEEGTILGFRLSGRYQFNEDDDPSAVPVYRVKDDVLAQLEANPVIDVGGDPIQAADFLTNDDVNALDAQPFEDQTRYSFTAKLDARLSDAIDVTLSGSYIDDTDRFTPNENSRTLANWRLLNAHNNPYDINTTARGNFRFRHRLGGGATDDESTNAVIRHVSYTLQAGYEQRGRQLTDSRHDYNYFDYGYIGQLETEYLPAFNLVFDTTIQDFKPIHVDYRQILRAYNPGEENSVLANYNNYLGIPTDEGLNAQIGDYFITGLSDNTDILSRTDFVAFNGTVSKVFEDSWGFHTNVGSVYNLAREFSQEVYTFNASASFDIVPNSSDQGKHSVQLGLSYEQRTNRLYDVFPQELWTVARQKANEHIQGIPFDEDGNPTTEQIGTIRVEEYRTDVPIYQVAITESEDNLFYQNLRASLGLPLTAFVNTDGLTPDQLSLDMFSAKELNDQGLLDYYGTDYLGNPYDGTFDDFFTATDANGVRTFPVAPSRPIYTAAYIQDKFKYKDDVIFRFGVRVDRYDANTKVLKDKYSLYEIMGANEYHGAYGGDQPGNIGDDYKVYLSDDGSSVKAYRDGDQWYASSGQPVNNATELFSGGFVTPKYADARVEDDLNFIKSRDFDPSVSFKDYEVQVNVMPRLAFSFPISSDANFFAHYDILVQRPPSNAIATPRDYFYFVDESSSIKDNPDLKPERTVDYEVGFQQKLSNSSALKMSAYYKEMRDMIQFRTIFPVPLVSSYQTYDNVDFGTVKGFSFQYDLRRTGNISLLANYTLQFADGTGSDANSARSISDRGVLRTLSPLSFDERHRIVASLDYRYDSGAKYTGPQIAGVDVFAKAGINLQTIAVSGRPYTRNLTPTELDGEQIAGAISGARKPWNYTLNLRIDKDFTIAKNYNMNVYLRVSNLLDTRNTIAVYPVTGSADDSGFLASSRGLDKLSDIAGTKRQVESYLASYQWRILNPNFYSLPRRIFVGASLSF